MSAAARALLDEHGAAVLEHCIKMARKGDRVALRLVVERVLPRAGREVRDELPALAGAADLVQAYRSIIAAAAGGAIALEEARELARLVEMQRRAMETEELAVRVEALEKGKGGKR